MLPGQLDKMDRMYRHQRHFYDLTRKYYLIGRDSVLHRMDIKPGEHVLEIGCGTARNLAKLVQLQPAAHYYGLDASQEMLKTAAKNLKRVKGGENVNLKTCLAENLSSRVTFGLNRPFDVILFSYTLSMIPTWHEALDTALANLDPKGRILIVDFWDQRELPRWFAKILVRWLDMFGVHHRPELMTRLQSLSSAGKIALDVEPVWKRYAFIASLRNA